jgi:hypothetical protein
MQHSSLFTFLFALLSAASPSLYSQTVAHSWLGDDFQSHRMAIQIQDRAFKKQWVEAQRKKPFFTVIEKKDDKKDEKKSVAIGYDLILREDQMDKPYLLAVTVEKGTGENGLLSAGASWLGRDSCFLILFKKISVNQIQLLRLNLDFRAKAGTPEAAFIDNSIPPQPLVTLPIVEEDKERGTFGVSADSLFLADLIQIAGRTHDSYSMQKDKIKFSVPDSAVKKITVFPDRLEVAVNLGFTASKNGYQDILAVGLRYVLARLPQSPSFKKRHADLRIGYFTTNYQDIRHPNAGFEPRADVHLITRWNLEPVRPIQNTSKTGEPPVPVAVKRPIVYWIDPSVPKVYRPAMEAGILAWNAAFAAIGFENPIVVKEVDRDMSAQARTHYDPDSLDYNVVRWYTAKDASAYFAIGPDRTNPFTGEIFNASVSMSDAFVQQGSFERFIRGKRGNSAEKNNDENSFLEKTQLAAAAGFAELNALRASPSARAEYLSQYLTQITMHEIGHTLGLRHNFKGSTAYPLSKMGKDGLISSSVMDYLPPHIAALGHKQTGPYFMTKPGIYDFWAIRYGYAPVADPKKLTQIAELAEQNPRLAYATDEDASSGNDPDAQMFDLGSSPIAYAQSQVQLANNFWTNLKSHPQQEDAARLLEDFSLGFVSYGLAEGAVLPLIGGVRTTRSPKGEQFHPVAPVEQRKALRFLSRHIFSDRDFRTSSRFLNLLGNDRLSNVVNQPFPLLDMVGSLQQETLQGLYSPSRLNNMEQASLYARPAGAMSVSELFFRIRRSVWGEIMGKKPRPMSIYRRQLQTSHVDILIQTMRGNAPEESRAAATRDLRLIKADCRKALAAHSLNEVTRLHLQAIVFKISRATKLAPFPE